MTEKRSYTANPNWDQETSFLASRAYKVNGSQATEEDSGGLKLAAVYSKDFIQGPGARLFYHADDETTAPYVQELIWDEATNIWSNGAKIADPLPNSQLSAVIDNNLLRLYYSAEGGTLRESILYLKPPKGIQTGVYYRGMHS